jgi:molybdate transport system substrate-binding protein
MLKAGILAGYRNLLYRPKLMRIVLKPLLLVLTVLVLTHTSAALAGEIRVAVAANFTAPLTELATLFEATTGHKITLIPGSTGKHYAQIIHGAPFDAFFAADAARPALLEKTGLIISGSRYSYALGRLVLWSPQQNLIVAGNEVLTTDSFRHLAIANPKLAPYGLAASEVLKQLGQWERLQAKLVRGENISQAFQFVYSGNAELGFIARSQFLNSTSNQPGSHWNVPATMHTPIIQQAVQLTHSETARLFLEFTRSPQAQRIIQNYGYDLPQQSDKQVYAKP